MPQGVQVRVLFPAPTFNLLLAPNLAVSDAALQMKIFSHWLEHAIEGTLGAVVWSNKADSSLLPVTPSSDLHLAYKILDRCDASGMDICQGS